MSFEMDLNERLGFSLQTDSNEHGGFLKFFDKYNGFLHGSTLIEILFSVITAPLRTDELPYMNLST